MSIMKWVTQWLNATSTKAEEVLQWKHAVTNLMSKGEDTIHLHYILAPAVGPLVQDPPTIIRMALVGV